MTIPYAKVRAEMMTDPEVKGEYGRLVPQFELAEELVSARMRIGLSQKAVEKLMGTTQSMIAKLESGRAKPSLRSLEHYAAAIGARIRYQLLPA